MLGMQLFGLPLVVALTTGGFVAVILGFVMVVAMGELGGDNSPRQDMADMAAVCSLSAAVGVVVAAAFWLWPVTLAMGVAYVAASVVKNSWSPKDWAAKK